MVLSDDGIVGAREALNLVGEIGWRTDEVLDSLVPQQAIDVVIVAHEVGGNTPVTCRSRNLVEMA